MTAHRSTAARPSPPALLALAALLALPQAVHADPFAGLLDGVRQANRAVRDAKNAIDKTRQKVDETKQDVTSPATEAKGALDEARALKDSIAALVHGASQLRGALPGGVPATGGDVAAAGDADAAYDLADADAAWRDAVAQALPADYCARFARRAKEKPELYRSRIRAERTNARVSVASLLTAEPALEVSVRGAAIELGGFTPGAAGGGWLNFSVGFVDSADGHAFHLVEGALAARLAAGPLEGDDRLVLHGTLACTRAVADRLRSGATPLEAHVTFERHAFTAAGATTGCDGIADIALSPSVLSLRAGGRTLSGVKAAFAAE